MYLKTTTASDRFHKLYLLALSNIPTLTLYKSRRWDYVAFMSVSLFYLCPERFQLSLFIRKFLTFDACKTTFEKSCYFTWCIFVKQVNTGMTVIYWKWYTHSGGTFCFLMCFIYLLLNLQVPNVLGTLPNTVLAFHTRENENLHYSHTVLYVDAKTQACRFMGNTLKSRQSLGSIMLSSSENKSV